MDHEVRADEWLLAPEMPENRRQILSDPLSAGDLMDELVRAAQDAADIDEFFVCWEGSTKRPGQARVSGVFRCPYDIFDQFFNARSVTGPSTTSGRTWARFTTARSLTGWSRSLGARATRRSRGWSPCSLTESRSGRPARKSGFGSAAIITSAIP
jgi:hypothetical protein